MSIHIHFIYKPEEERLNKSTDVIDCKYYCSDFCNQRANGENYQGWNGCHEIDESQPCDNCGKKIIGIEEYDNSYWSAMDFVSEIGSDYDKV